MILNLPQVAKLLDLHPNTVYRLAQRRQLPSAKIGGQWRFDQTVLEGWVSQQMVTRMKKN